MLLDLSTSFKDLDVLTTRSSVFGGMLDGHRLCPRFKMVSFCGYPRIQHAYHLILLFTTPNIFCLCFRSLLSKNIIFYCCRLFFFIIYVVIGQFTCILIYLINFKINNNISFLSITSTRDHYSLAKILSDAFGTHQSPFTLE